MNSDAYRRGIELFNSGAFFDAHEVWEDVWREARGPEKKFLQGLIQVAVAFHHYSTGNLAGASSVLERARKNVADFPAEFGGISVAALRESLASWQEALRVGGPYPGLPRLETGQVRG